MNKTQRNICLLIFLLFNLGEVEAQNVSLSRAKNTPQLILTNAKIADVESKVAGQLFLEDADAIAIEDGRILAIGATQEILKQKQNATRVIDLQGKLVVPGFIESHGHLNGTGAGLKQLDLTQAESWQEIVELVKGAIKKAKPGEWIIGNGWHQSLWKTKPKKNVEGYPFHDELSKVSPNNPVLLRHRSGHMCFANQKAMLLAEVSKSTTPPSGGEILRNEKDEPIGVFRETAQGMIYQARDKSESNRSAADFVAEFNSNILLAQKECLKYGVTTFCDAGIVPNDVRLYKQLVDRDLLKLRIWAMLRTSNQQLEREIPKLEKLRDYGGSRLQVGGIKQMVDGALGAHGAWLLEPYSDLSDSRGLVVTPVKTIRDTAQIAFDQNLQLCVHAIGDRANREILDLFESFYQKAGDRSLRWRIEHSQHLHVDDIPRFGKLGVIASMQAIHCTSDGPFVPTRLGAERSRRGAYAWRSLLDTNAIIANGSDAPVEPVNPLLGFHSSITRKMKNGKTFFEEQKMTRKEALRSYTLDAAFAIFQEKERGSIKVGKQADMVVLSQNILTVKEDQIPETEVEMTIIDGEVVYSAKK